MKTKILVLLGLSLLIICFASPVQAKPVTSAITPSLLRCEYRINPLGIDSPHPRLDWSLEASDPTARGVSQSAYQILVASSPEILAQDKGDLWDCGKISSERTIQIAYEGKPLGSAQPVWWKLRVWDQAGNPSPWSGVAQWTMGLLTESAWKEARWIGAPSGETATDKLKSSPGFTPNGTTLLKRGFETKPGLQRALIFVCGLGQQVLSLDGHKVTSDLFDPGFTDYRKTCLYGTYDITDSLKQAGPHTLELLLGNGFYSVSPAPGRYIKTDFLGGGYHGGFGPRKGIALVRLEYSDGTVEHLPTDEKWQATPGATTFANVYAGEDVDARLDDDAKRDWQSAIKLPPPGGQLLGANAAAPPVRMDEVFKPVSVKQRSPSISVYDFGQNATMIPRLVVKGPAGSSVRMIPAEVLYPDGTLNRKTCTQDGEKPVWWQYTLAGKGIGTESYLPQFFWHANRYLQVELMPATPGGELPKIESLESCSVHSTAPRVGEFSCSHELLNKIFSLVRWAQLNNMQSLLTDCPHRERWGWLEEDHLNGPSLRYNFDMEALFNKIMRDMADDQLPNGLVPNFVPEYTPLGGAFRDSTEWGSSLILVAWQQYQFYGDKAILARYYESMQRYFNYLNDKAKDHIVGDGLGDWYDIGPKPPNKPQLTPVENTDTCFYFHDAEVMAKIAALLGKKNESVQYAKQADEIRAAFNRKFFNSATGNYSTGSQGANAIPYEMGIVEPQYRSALFKAIIEDLKNHGNAFTTGEVAYRYLLRALADEGRSDMVLAINDQTEKPGYGMQIRKGLTSLGERWDGEPTEWASQSHFMSGEIIEWFYHDLAGIQQDESAPAFQKIIIKPAVVGDITWVKASYHSISGKIISEWIRKGSALTLKVAIPPNTTATLYVPTSDASTVMENGKPATQSPGLHLIRFEAPYAIFTAASGSYTFSSLLN